ncbi:unnamed protein product [Bemisia tabaci]|uniref:Ubiquitin carboxyl-terminal hydrolase 47 n=2 Tax=Bemisia tabaci TaxID=7038 RepID=A0A9P0CEM7_BEMTA|nr:unnamed protein product [Bemisia tabaci]
MGMSSQGELCDRVQCSIKFNSEEIQLWVPQEKPVCDFVKQVLHQVRQEPGLYQITWICEPENKVLCSDASVSLQSLGITNRSSNHFLVSPVPAHPPSGLSEDDSEPLPEFNTGDDELALGASASPTNLAAPYLPPPRGLSLNLNQPEKMEEVERQLESDPLDIPAEDELGLGASASPTSTSSIPTPPPQPPSPPTPYFSSGDGKRDIKDGLSTTQRSWQVDNVPSTSTSRRTGYVGLVNQAMTCYLNSLLQALYMTPEFRNALYSWEFDGSASKQPETKSIPYQLQKLFLNLQTSSKSAVETTELTQSFGWDSSEAWQQHDIQELCRVMFDALEQKFKGTEQANLINKLYQGKMIDYVKCLECKREKQREDTFLDIPLPIRPFGATSAYSSIEEALRGFVKPETLDGNNQYFCESCAKKCDAHKGLKFTHFPYLLTFHLMRFDFDYKTMHRIKLNDRVTFPEILNLDHFFEDNSIGEKETLASGEKNDDNSTADSGSALDEDSCLPSVESTLATPSQEMDQDSDEGIEVGCTSNGLSKDVTGKYVYELFSIMIHSGSASGGHYYAYIKDFSSQKWFCFNDQSVSPLMPEDIEKTFGGGSRHAYYSGAYSSSTNAYMLMYRQIDKEKNAFAMTADEFPQHIKKLYERLEEKEKADPYAEMDYKFSMRCKVMEDGSRPEKFSYDAQRKERKENLTLEPSQTSPKVLEKRVRFKSRRKDSTSEDASRESDSEQWEDRIQKEQWAERMTKNEPFNIVFFYPKSNAEFSSRNPYSPDSWRADWTYEISACYSKLVDDVYQILKPEVPSLEKNQLLIYCKRGTKIDCLLEGKDDDTIASLLAKHGHSVRSLYHVTARTHNSKLNSVLCLPGNDKITVHKVDIDELEVSKGRFVYCAPTLSVEQFKNCLRSDFDVPEGIKFMVAVEIPKLKSTDLDRRSSSLHLEMTRLKFLVNDKATLKQEQVSSAMPVYVSFIFNGMSTRSVMERMLKAIDCDKNSVTVNFKLPDADPIILERLSIPCLEKEKKSTVNQKENKTVEETPPTKEFTKNTDPHRLRILTDTSFVPPKGDSCSLTIGGDSGGGVVDPGGHAVTACSGDAPNAKPICSVPNLENIEEEQIHFSDQSASEESSLTDSERTIIGDSPDDCPMSSASNSPDTSFQMSQDLIKHYQTSLSNIIDISPVNTQQTEPKEDFSDESSYIISSSDFPVTSYRCKCLSGKSQNGLKQMSVDKRMPFPTLLENLEPFVGVSSQYFKIYSSKKSYEIRDEFDFVRYYQTENSFVIKLEPHLKHGETKVKVFFLPAVILPTTEIPLVFDWILKKGEPVAEAKHAMLKELVRIKGFDIPPEKYSMYRLRKKSAELGRICLDIELWDEDIPLLKKNEQLILQELKEPEIKTNPDQMAVYIRRWDPLNQTQGEIIEIVLEEDATRTTLIDQISKVSGIPAEHIDVAKSHFLFPDSHFTYQTGDSKANDSSALGELRWNDTEEDLKESSLRIGGDGAVLLYIDKRDEGSSLHSSKVPLRCMRTSQYESDPLQRDMKYMLENLSNSQKIKCRNPVRKEKGLKIHLGSSPVNSNHLTGDMEE